MFYRKDLQSAADVAAYTAFQSLGASELQRRATRCSPDYEDELSGFDRSMRGKRVFALVTVLGPNSPASLRRHGDYVRRHPKKSPGFRRTLF